MAMRSRAALCGIFPAIIEQSPLTCEKIIKILGQIGIPLVFNNRISAAGKRVRACPERRISDQVRICNLIWPPVIECDPATILALVIWQAHKRSDAMLQRR